MQKMTTRPGSNPILHPGYHNLGEISSRMVLGQTSQQDIHAAEFLQLLSTPRTLPQMAGKLLMQRGIQLTIQIGGQFPLGHFAIHALTPCLVFLPMLRRSSLRALNSKDSTLGTPSPNTSPISR